MSDTYAVMSDAELAARIANAWSPVDSAKALHEQWSRKHPRPCRHPATFVGLTGFRDPISEVIAKAVLANLCHPERFHLCQSRIELYGQVHSVAETLAESRTDDPGRASAIASELADRFVSMKAAGGAS